MNNISKEMEEQVIQYTFNRYVDIKDLYSFMINELSFSKVKELYDLFDYCINTNLLVEELKGDGNNE